MLHTVNKSPFSHNSLESCLRFINDGDVLLLTEDGVLAAAAETSKSSLVKDALVQNKVYALQADLKARSIDTLIDGVEVIDYDGWVKLLEQHQTHAWL